MEHKNKAFGYGQNTTGGSLDNKVIISSFEEFNDLKKDISNKIVYINGEIEFKYAINLTADNFSIIGLTGAKFISNEQTKETSGTLRLIKCKNVIIRNIEFKGPGAYDCNGYDNLSCESCNDIWVDHCDFQDGCDGNFDIKNDSDRITISWCRFRYLKSPKYDPGCETYDHRFSNLVGSKRNDMPTSGNYHISYYACWWDEGCKARMPRCRNALIEMISCYWGVSRCQYHIGPENSVCLLRNCEFNGKERVSRFGGYIFVKSDETILYESRPEEITEDMKQFHNEYDDIEKEKVIEVITDEENGSGNTLKIEL